MSIIKSVAAAAIAMIGAAAAQASTYSAFDLGIAVDNSTDSTSFEVKDTSTISSIEVTLGISACNSSLTNGQCETNDFSITTFNEELSLSLTSAAGTVIELVREGTYSGQDLAPNVNLVSALVTFEDGASPVGGPALVDGTFAPVDSLSSLLGELAAGLWTITIGDDFSADPKFLDSYSVTINGADDDTNVVPLPAGLPLLLTALGGAGLLARRRRKA